MFQSQEALLEESNGGEICGCALFDNPFSKMDNRCLCSRCCKQKALIKQLKTKVFSNLLSYSNTNSMINRQISLFYQVGFGNILPTIRSVCVPSRVPV